MKPCRIIISFLLLFALLFPANVNANSAPDTVSEIIYLDNGCYITIKTTILAERSSTVRRGNRSYIYKNSSGVEEWRATIYGTWTYTGTSATCTAVSCSTTITDTVWYEISNTTGKSGATATAEVTMGEKFLGITINKESISLRLTCDANGNLS